MDPENHRISKGGFLTLEKAGIIRRSNSSSSSFIDSQKKHSTI
jgi:hypothetical protein